MSAIRGVRFSFVTAAIIAAFLVGGGCEKKPDASGFDRQETLRLAFISNNPSEFWILARAGCLEAKSRLENVEVDFRDPIPPSAEEQISIIESLVARKISGIAISPIDPLALVDAINRASTQALVITQDSDSPSSSRAFYIGTDNFAAGRQAGELILEALPSGGKVAIFVGSLETDNARERTRGIRHALASSDVEIVGILIDRTDRLIATENARQIIDEHPDLAGAIGLWSYNGPILRNAVAEAGKSGQIKIVCFDENPETLAGVADGSIFATVVQQPYRFGQLSIELMARKLRGEPIEIPPDKRIFVPTEIVKADNVRAFQEQIRTLLEEMPRT
jgi:ribose transport system substrate-binding protein